MRAIPIVLLIAALATPTVGLERPTNEEASAAGSWRLALEDAIGRELPEEVTRITYTLGPLGEVVETRHAVALDAALAMLHPFGPVDAPASTGQDTIAAARPATSSPICGGLGAGLLTTTPPTVNPGIPIDVPPLCGNPAYPAQAGLSMTVTDGIVGNAFGDVSLMHPSGTFYSAVTGFTTVDVIGTPIVFFIAGWYVAGFVADVGVAQTV